MNPEYWQKIESLFHQALEKPEHQRQSFIEKECKGDTVLLDELKTLLKNSENEDSISNIVQVNAEQLSELNDPWIDQTIDQYKIIEEIAVGGMGAVYIGERTDSEYRQKVAIKLMSHGLVSKQARQRFLSERQILANLSHPNIASLFDGGTTDSGVPYLVMEFIEGIPIDQYCDQKQLSINQRIRLLLKVCKALQYAHQNLVIHRDIKTSNILVTKDGEPKLLDFGIAKLLEQQPMEHTVALTRTEMRLLTPEYASPEQIRGEPISTATDVYGLGILLFKLLTGYFPFMVASYSPAELEQLICQQPAPKPSAVVAKNANDEIAQNRSASLKKLQREIQGDLDNILLLALSKETSRRYNTIDAMAEDMKNFLYHLPVKAQAPSFKYRLIKFIRRNSFSVITTTGVLLSIAAVILFYTWQLTEQRNIAIAAEIKAQQRAENLKETTDFIISLFTTANPRSKGSQFVTARDLLDEAISRINVDLKTDTLSKAQMLYNIGLAYNALNLPEKAIKVHKQALRIHFNLFGSESVEISEILNRLGDALRKSGKNEEGYQYLKKGLEMRIKLIGKDTNDIADSYNNLAMAVRNLGRLDEALELQHRAVAMHLKVSDPKTETIHVPINNLALLYRDKREFKKSLEYSKQALQEFYNRGQQTDVLGLLFTSLNFANVAYRMGENEVAKKVLSKSLEAALKKYPESLLQIIIAKRLLAQIEHHLGNLVVADKMFKENINTCLINCKKNPILIPITQKYWALLKREMGDITTAQKLIALSVAGYGRYSKPTSRSIILTKLFQADIALTASDYPLYDKVMANLESRFSRTSPSEFHINYYNMLKAKFYFQTKEYEKALQLITGAVDFFLNETGALSPNYLSALAIQNKIKQNI